MENVLYNVSITYEAGGSWKVGDEEDGGRDKGEEGKGSRVKSESQGVRDGGEGGREGGVMGVRSGS